MDLLQKKKINEFEDITIKTVSVFCDITSKIHVTRIQEEEERERDKSLKKYGYDFSKFGENNKPTDTRRRMNPRNEKHEENYIQPYHNHST